LATFTIGFLDEYRSLLEPGKRDEEALLRYQNPKADWPAYDNILLEVVTVWGAASSTLSSKQREDLQQLVDSFYHTLALRLSKDYEMVGTPSPGTVRIQAVITHGPSETATA